MEVHREGVPHSRQRMMLQTPHEPQFSAMRPHNTWSEHGCRNGESVTVRWEELTENEQEEQNDQRNCNQTLDHPPAAVLSTCCVPGRAQRLYSGVASEQ